LYTKARLEHPRYIQTKTKQIFPAPIEQTQTDCQRSGIIETVFEEGDPDVAKQISKIEKDADESGAVLIEELMRTFVTPFDRERLFLALPVKLMMYWIMPIQRLTR